MMTNFIKSLVKNHAIELTLISLILLLLVTIICLSIKEGKDWAEFKSANNCVLTDRMSGHVTTIPIVNSGGGVSVGTSVTPDKEAWLCDDGVTYWR